VWTARFEMGKEVGSYLIRQISQAKSVSSWGPEEFCQYFIEENLESGGIVSEVERRTEKEVVFSYYNCPFEELALKYSVEICDYLDKGFYEGIAQGIGGNARFERIACLAHGDEKCKYVLRWERSSRGKAQGQELFTPKMALS
ncbi:MAG: hypothetical protein LN412_05695, partial [Candidatus Thermoplasmatota archaeon]|nr:hypothetical protein [Candidatus Thermoplasmatota archaeon]